MKTKWRRLLLCLPLALVLLCGTALAAEGGRYALVERISCVSGSGGTVSMALGDEAPAVTGADSMWGAYNRAQMIMDDGSVRTVNLDRSYADGNSLSVPAGEIVRCRDAENGDCVLEKLPGETRTANTLEMTADGRLTGAEGCTADGETMFVIRGRYAGAGTAPAFKAENNGGAAGAYLRVDESGRLTHVFAAGTVTGGVAAPADPRWGVDENGNARPGCMSWTAEGSSPDYFEFQVYRDGVEITQGPEREYDYRNGSRHSAMFLSYLNEISPLAAGEYTFRVRGAVGYGEEKAVSEWSEASAPYSFTPPADRLTAPGVPRWAGLYPLMTWTPAEDAADAHSYYVRYYYSSAPDGTPEPYTGTLHMDLENGVTSNSVFVDEMMERIGAGWYYFTVQAVSGNLDKVLNSPESAMSDAIYYDGGKVANGGMDALVTASGVEAAGGRIAFDVSAALADSFYDDGRDGALFAVGYTGGVVSDVAYTTKSSDGFDLKGTKAKVFFLDERTLIPLAKALEVGG